MVVFGTTDGTTLQGFFVGSVFVTPDMEQVSAGGTASGTTVSSGGEQDVFAGGTAIGTIVAISGTEMVLQSGTATSVTVYNGGTEFVGGTATSMTVNEGGTEYDGGITTSIIVSSGGTEIVSSGTAISTIVEYGGVQDVGGNESMTHIPFDGTASATTVESGGKQTVFGGTVISAIVYDGTENVSGGETSHTTLSGGKEDVLGGEADDTIVGNSGTLILEALITSVSDNSGTASGTIVEAGGLEDVKGLAIGTTVDDGGTQKVFGGGQFDPTGGAINTIVNNGGTEIVYGQANNTWVNAGGTENVYGSAIDTTVSAGGTENVYSGGAEFVSGTGTGATINNSGKEVVEAFGTATRTTVNGGGLEYISTGGLAIGTTVNVSGEELVSGTASRTIVRGFEDIVTGATAVSAVISNGGVQNVYASGTASNTTVRQGGVEVLDSAPPGSSGTGSASDTVINSGGVVTIFGGTLELNSALSATSGAIVFSGTVGILKLYGATLSADTMSTSVISGLTPGDTIDLTSVSFASGGSVQLLAGNILKIVENGGSATIALDPLKDFSSSSFKLVSDGGGGTDIEVRSGLSMNLTFEFNVFGVDHPDPGFTSAIISAATYFENTFSNPVTLNIDIGWGSVSGFVLPPGVGAVSIAISAPSTYTFNQVSAADTYLSGQSDVTNGGTFVLSEADAKALGLVSSGSSENGGNFDGFVGFNPGTTWNFGSTGVDGAVYITGIAEHEISELMGRVDRLISRAIPTTACWTCSAIQLRVCAILRRFHRSIRPRRRLTRRRIFRRTMEPPIWGR